MRSAAYQVACFAERLARGRRNAQAVRSAFGVRRSHRSEGIVAGLVEEHGIGGGVVTPSRDENVPARHRPPIDEAGAAGPIDSRPEPPGEIGKVETLVRGDVPHGLPHRLEHLDRPAPCLLGEDDDLVAEVADRPCPIRRFGSDRTGVVAARRQIRIDDGDDGRAAHQALEGHEDHPIGRRGILGDEDSIGSVLGDHRRIEDRVALEAHDEEAGGRPDLRLRPARHRLVGHAVLVPDVALVENRPRGRLRPTGGAIR